MVAGLCILGQVTKGSFAPKLIFRSKLALLVNLSVIDAVEVGKEVLQLSAKDKWLSVALKSDFEFSVIQKVAEIDMKESTSRVFQHVVARVAVLHAENVSSNALAGQR